MKFVAVFLACIFAAQAATPSYEYWCAHNLQVFPPQSYYCYRVAFKNVWCTSKYYANCLVQFPVSKEGSCDAEIDDLDQFISQYELKLAEARETIRTEMLENKSSYFEQIDNIQAEYLATFESYLKNCYDEDSDEYKSAVAEYQEKLFVARQKAEENFETAVNNAIERIVCFHDRLIASFRSCLESRSSRIAKYNADIDAKALEIKEKYAKKLEDIIVKRVEWADKVFKKLYVGTDGNANAAVEKLQCSLIIQMAVFTGDFNGKVDQAVTQMKESYRCNYKCSFNTGCYGFSRKSYSRSCVRFPAPEKCSYKLFGMCAFNADWKGCAFKCLTTCTEDEKCQSFDEQAHIDAIKKSAEEQRTELAAKVVEWNKQVADWKVQASKCLEEKVSKMIPMTYCGVEPTQEEIDCFRQQLQGQADAWIETQEKYLAAQIECIQNRINEKINAWETKSIAFVGKIKEQFNKCVASKDTKLVEYKKCLDERRVAQRAQLEKNLNRRAECHMQLFEKFYDCTFGDLPEEEVWVEQKKAYKQMVDQKVLDVLKKFDDFWNEWQPKLQEHYVCSLKCSVKVTTPSLKLSYKWNFCAPCAENCRFYVC